jgi:hypothetical protein
MRQFTRRRGLVLIPWIALTLGGIVACEATSVSPVPTATLDPAVVAASIEFRHMVGLRSDTDWVERVLANPTASRDTYGVPLLPDEVATLEARAREGEQLSLITEQYGADHPLEWAGGYLRETGGYVVRFTRHIDEHRAALSKLVDPHADLVVEPAEWSYAELSVRRQSVENDLDWLRDLKAVPAGTGIDVVTNTVLLRLSSANPDAPRLAMSHYDGDDWLRVTSDGVGQWAGRRGTVIVVAVDPLGRPVPFLKVAFSPDQPSAHLEDGYFTGEDGRVTIASVPATGFKVELQVENDSAPGYKIVGASHVFVAPDSETAITILVTGRIRP